MYLKTAIVLTWFFGSYVLLLFAATSLWTVVPLTIMLGLGLAAIGFNIQHDGGHKAYSSRPWVNRVMAKTMDMVGASSYIWAWKHNTFHHTYPNIDGHDDDIDLGFLARMSPHQKRLRFHRAQGVYLWFLYGFITLKWHLFDDFYDVIRGRIGDHKIPRPQGKALFTFIVGKALFFSMVFLIPMLLHPWWAVLLVYVTAAFINGVIVSIVFQLAHCVEEADFPAPATTGEITGKMETDWAVHQVQTTVDFARGNRTLSWLLGGLNFQIEHHLLSKVCHVHYPALSKVVEEVCEEFGIQYSCHRSFWSALVSHAKWITKMGRPVHAA